MTTWLVKYGQFKGVVIATDTTKAGAQKIADTLTENTPYEHYIEEFK